VLILFLIQSPLLEVELGHLKILAAPTLGKVAMAVPVVAVQDKQLEQIMVLEIHRLQALLRAIMEALPITIMLAVVEGLILLVAMGQAVWEAMEALELHPLFQVRQ
jgi:hypothetical protein